MARALAEYAEEYLEQPEEPINGNVNEVAFGKHRVARKYKEAIWVQRAWSNFRDEGYAQSAEERMRNAEKAYEKREEIGFRVPERVHSVGLIEEVEKVEGKKLSDYLIEKDSEEIGDVITRFAHGLKQTHENNHAVRDTGLDNFIYEDMGYVEDESISIIDTEWFEENASEEYITDDLRGLAVNIALLPERKRNRFIEIFEREYGEDIRDYVNTRAKRDMILQSAQEALTKKEISGFRNTLDYLSHL